MVSFATVVAAWGAAACIVGSGWPCQNAVVIAFTFTKVPNSLLDYRHPQSDRRRRSNDPSILALPGGNNNFHHHHQHRRGGTLPRGKQNSGLGGGVSAAASGASSSSSSSLAVTNGVTADDGARSRGRLLLVVVACLYGTLNVVMRFVYDVPDIPPTAAALSATRGWLAFLCFLPPLLLDHHQKQQRSALSESESSTATTNTPNETDDDEGAPKPPAPTPAPTPPRSLLLRSGLELATWGFLAQGLLNIGLLSTGSARASFLTQTSVLFTPLIATSIGRQSVGRTVWLACWVALAGLVVLTLGGGGAGGTAAAALAVSLSRGDLFVLGGALSWSMYLFRLSALGPKHPDLVLQGVKTGLMAILYSIWWVGSAVAAAAGRTAPWCWWKLAAAVPSWMASGWVVWAALVFSAVGPGTIADVLQQKGQAHVAPSEANILLSAEPVFATILAVLLLGERSTLPELAGGALILVAAVVASA